jgi:3-hydroxyisobutyrate dehydrogenase-like beta-hydroxyacid dehydrogenase
LKEDVGMKERVGFIGLGIMGAAMAARIVQAGYPLRVFNRSQGKSDRLRDLGAVVSESPLSVVEASDVVILMVTGPEAIEDLLWGPEGAGPALNKDKVLINMSTVSPRFTVELNERLASQNVDFVDAPVSGSKKPAEDGTLLILAGGDQNRVNSLTPLFETMGKKVIYCGQAGQGSMMKMAVNLLLGIMMEGFAEVLHFGKKGGLSMDAMLDTVFSGPLNCGLFQMKSQMIQDNDFPPHFPLKHITKDLKFISDTAYETGAAVPVCQTLLHLYSIGVGQQWGDMDLTAIAKVIEHLSAKE